MARVTVEDCIDKIPNRFELVMLSSRRAKDLSSGAMLTIERDRDKNSVVSLREIAEETLDLKDLRESIVRSYQKVTPVEESDEDLESILAADKEGAADLIPGQVAYSQVDTDTPPANVPLDD